MAIIVSTKAEDREIPQTLTHRPRFQGPYFTLFTIRMTSAHPFFGNQQVKLRFKLKLTHKTIVIHIL